MHARVLKDYVKDYVATENGATCFDCGALIVYLEGCISCSKLCGYLRYL